MELFSIYSPSRKLTQHKHWAFDTNFSRHLDVKAKDHRVLILFQDIDQQNLQLLFSALLILMWWTVARGVVLLCSADLDVVDSGQRGCSSLLDVLLRASPCVAWQQPAWIQPPVR